MYSGDDSTAMGFGTIAFAPDSTAMGHDSQALGDSSTAMGYKTTASGAVSTAMGFGTEASGPYSTAMGDGTLATGEYSTALGVATHAAGLGSFAAGVGAVASERSFAWSDGTGGSAFQFYESYLTNSFMVEASGGAYFAIDTQNSFCIAAKDGSNHIYWSTGNGSWTFVSDRNSKDHFAPVNGQEVLNKLARVPITEWSYKGYGQRHIGPMAQDFHELFPFNDSDTTLNEADLHGVALAAIQGLNQKVEEQENALKEKETEIQDLKQSLAELRKLVESLAPQQPKGGAQ